MAKKPNPYLEKLADQQAMKRINELIEAGELMTRNAADDYVRANNRLMVKIMTIAVNKGCGIGKLRFERDVQPIFDGLVNDYFKRVDEDGGDQEYALDYVERLYQEVVHDEANQ